MVLILDNKFIATLVKMIKQDSTPALGCTEPIAVALAGAATRDYITDTIKSIEVLVSKNIFKNGKFVLIPNTNRWGGLDLAAALGVLGGDRKYGLMVLKDIDDKIIEEAQK